MHTYIGYSIACLLHCLTLDALCWSAVLLLSMHECQEVSDLYSKITLHHTKQCAVARSLWFKSATSSQEATFAVGKMLCNMPLQLTIARKESPMISKDGKPAHGTKGTLSSTKSFDIEQVTNIRKPSCGQQNTQ
jgi:hypothetical protein